MAIEKTMFVISVGMFTQNSGFTSPPPAPGRFYPPPRCTSPGSTLYTSSSPNMSAQYNGYVPAAEQATGRRSGIRPSRPQRPNTQSTPGVNNTWQNGTNAPHRKHQVTISHCLSYVYMSMGVYVYMYVLTMCII